MLDATRLHHLGIPTVAIVWDSFVRAAKSMADLHQAPDLPIVVIPKVGPGETAEDQRKKAALALPDLIDAWRGRPLAP